MCDNCWTLFFDDKQPVRCIGEEHRESCCWCDQLTDGIYVRHEPELLNCKGEHS